MSIKDYYQDIESLLHQVRALLASGSLGTGLLEKNIKDAFDSTIKDLTDYADMFDYEILAKKLRSLTAENQSGYGLGGRNLEAIIERHLRAIRSFGEYSPLDDTGVKLPTNADAPLPAKISPDNKRIFVVHGHDDSVLNAVARLLTDLDLTPIILREQPNQGRAIIEKFEANSNVGFAVILMTSDDMGADLKAASHNDYKTRARQNVVLELGYFVGRLGRSRVCVLKSESVEVPTDILGVVYTLLDVGNAWQLTLGKELKAAGYEVNLNNLAK